MPAGESLARTEQRVYFSTMHSVVLVPWDLPGEHVAVSKIVFVYSYFN